MTQIKKGRGRKTKLDNKKVVLFLGGRDAGMSIDDSSTLAGISKQTTYNWLKRGKQAEKEIQESIEKDPDYDERNHSDFEFYQFHIANIQGEKKLSLELRQNLRTLAKDRRFTDKDGVERIDKPGSVAANLAILKTIDKDFKEEQEAQGQGQSVIVFNNIKEDEKDDILEKMAAAQSKQQQNLLQNDDEEEQF